MLKKIKDFLSLKSNKKTKDITNSDIQKVFEPQEYFDILKENIKTIDVDILERNLKQVSKIIVDANELGQESLVKSAINSYKNIHKEQMILAAGFYNFVYDTDVKQFIKNVTPKNSVKLIELSRYQRVIPEDNMAIIKKAQDIGVFDEIHILFTDFTNDNMQTEEEKEIVERNKDPIAFGIIHTENKKRSYGRLYFITDWIDEYCDLTLTKMIDEMSKMDIKDPLKSLHPDVSYVNDIIKEFEQKEKAIENSNQISTAVFL